MRRDYRGKKGWRGFGTVVPDSSTRGQGWASLVHQNGWTRVARLQRALPASYLRSTSHEATPPSMFPRRPTEAVGQGVDHALPDAPTLHLSLKSARACPGLVCFMFHHTPTRRPDSRDSRKLSRKQISGVRARTSHRGCQEAAHRCDGDWIRMAGEGNCLSMSPDITCGCPPPCLLNLLYLPGGRWMWSGQGSVPPSWG
jgi:hypothetical protein